MGIHEGDHGVQGIFMDECVAVEQKDVPALCQTNTLVIGFSKSQVGAIFDVLGLRKRLSGNGYTIICRMVIHYQDFHFKRFLCFIDAV